MCKLTTRVKLRMACAIIPFVVDVGTAARARWCGLVLVPLLRSESVVTVNFDARGPHMKSVPCPIQSSARAQLQFNDRQSRNRHFVPIIICSACVMRAMFCPFHARKHLHLPLISSSSTVPRSRRTQLYTAAVDCFQKPSGPLGNLPSRAQSQTKTVLP